MKLNFWKKKSLLTTPGNGGWRILESYSGAFQQDVVVDRGTVLASPAIFSCITLIASDIAKLRPTRVKLIDGIWQEQPLGNIKVIGKPNAWQNRIQFYENWINSKLSRGNAYILKSRDAKRKVTSLHVLNPDLVSVLVSEDGEVFYRLSNDNMTGLKEQITVPHTEIIHDRFNCLFHPLVGLSPIFASGLSALNGINISKNSTKFFENMSRPSGILTAPETIDAGTAERLKKHWEDNYGANNVGRVAVVGDGLTYTALSINAEQSQLVEQLKMTAETVCATFHVPKHKVLGDPPSYNNIEALEQQYYSQCLQVLMESIEICLNEGLDLAEDEGTQFALDGLLRMDTATTVKTLAEEVKGGISTPNEARRARNKPRIDGGDTVYLQEQNFSLAALAKRDAKEDPFNKSSDKKEEAQSEEEQIEPSDEENLEKFSDYLIKAFEIAPAAA